MFSTNQEVPFEIAVIRLPLDGLFAAVPASETTRLGPPSVATIGVSTNVFVLLTFLTVIIWPVLDAADGNVKVTELEAGVQSTIWSGVPALKPLSVVVAVTERML